MGIKKTLASIAAAVVLSLPVSARAAAIPLSNVSSPNNPADTTGFGSVPHSYSIGKYEVTNSQYADFLNSIAKSDPLEYFNSGMQIARTGGSGNFSYAPAEGKENNPITNVSWFDAMAFVNWLELGQPTSTNPHFVRAGATYDLTSFFNLPTSRNPDSKWVLPTEDEWYKAAYHNGNTDAFWLYPTRSSSAPIAELPPGGINSANYNNLQNQSTEVGVYPESKSFYNTFDMAGNAWEITEFPGVLRGGSFDSSDFAHSGKRFVITNPFEENDELGFRVAYIPEPASLTMLASMFPFLKRKNN